MKIKKIISGAVLGLTLLSGVFCAPGRSSMSAIEGKDGVFAILETEKGEIVLNLFYKETPMTVTNFVGLAEGTLDAAKGKPFYNGLKFHRVINDFMIQGGDPEGTGRGGPGYKFPDEFVEGLIFDKPGKLAMANSGANTNGSQFFITHVPTDWLNYKHTIFGEVVTGQDVVDSVKQNDTIKKLTIVRQGADAQNFKCTQADFDARKAAAKKANEEREAKKMAAVIDGCDKSANGIYFKVLKEGKGSTVGAGKKVSVDYKGYLIDGSIFDASIGFHPQGHEPLEFKTAGGQMIPGFDQMVQEMKVGETRKMVIPPELAYGSYGVPQAGIPGNSYICFDVKVISAK
ncbi:MAG: peptidylprolyl isomerase [Treponema sp.]|nr:peptidylprolyl isomerase [Spirochaetia bacterium]MDY2839344.1 peptidylprolyl isomerase [Treponema sp.]MDY5124254.1 peptidylprolyl isomerase [Treponema sp.]